MSSTNRKRAARALAAQAGITYQQALAQVLTGQSAPVSPSPVCDRCGSAWGTDETCQRCTTEDGAPRPIDQRGPLGPGASAPAGTPPMCPVCEDNENIRFIAVRAEDPRPWECRDCGTLFADGDPYAGLDIVWADDNGQFLLHGGTMGNPGCDGCGSADAVARINGEYACVEEVAGRHIALPDAFHCFTCGRDWAYQFSDDCRECRGALTCHECGQEMIIEDGTEVSHHVDANDEIDYDADGDHVAYAAPAPATRCARCNGDISHYGPGQTLCVWCSGESED